MFLGTLGSVAQVWAADWGGVGGVVVDGCASTGSNYRFPETK